MAHESKLLFEYEERLVKKIESLWIECCLFHCMSPIGTEDVWEALLFW